MPLDATQTFVRILTKVSFLLLRAPGAKLSRATTTQASGVSGACACLHDACPIPWDASRRLFQAHSIVGAWVLPLPVRRPTGHFERFGSMAENAG